MEHAIVLYLNQLAAPSPPLSGAVVFLAHYFPYLVGLGFVVFVLACALPQKERCLALVEGFGAAVLARGAVEAIRLFIHRPRPFIDDSAIVALINETSYSFPSGHAAFFFALATVTYMQNRQWGIWFYAASVVIGFARIAAGVHYPTDILGGAALGVAVGYVVVRLCRNSQCSATV